MKVIDILHRATLHGVALALADLVGLKPDEINKQLRKAIDILSLAPVPTEMVAHFIYHIPDVMDPLWADAYWCITGFSNDPDDNDGYCMALVPWDEWLSMHTIVNGPPISYDEMAALLLYEMTSSGNPGVASAL